MIQDRDDDSSQPQSMGAMTDIDFEELFNKNRRLLLWYFQKEGFSNSDAEELTQDTFIRVLNGLGDFKGLSTPRTWIMAIAARVASNKRRAGNTRKRKKEEVSLEQPLPNGNALENVLKDERELGNPEAEILRSNASEQLHEHVELLPPRMRTTVRLHLQDRTNKEIARIMGNKIGTVGAQLAEARKLLRSLMTEDKDSDG